VIGPGWHKGLDATCCMAVQSGFPLYPEIPAVRLSARNQHLKSRDIKTMHTFVAFLRGINVGGNTMVSMKELAAICTQNTVRKHPHVSQQR
jgi:hypothetical protein